MKHKGKKILVSGCLFGARVRYDGEDNWVFHPFLIKMLNQGGLVLVCPEVSGGLPIPRVPAEIIDGEGKDVLAGKAKIKDRDGRDVTAEFLKGAENILQIAISSGAKLAILKDGSPSCGSISIYDGTFSDKKKPGQGVTSALLEQHGIKVFDEKAIDQAAEYFRLLKNQS